MSSQLKDINDDSSFNNYSYYSDEKNSDSLEKDNQMEVINETDEVSPKNPKIMLNFRTLKRFSSQELGNEGENMTVS